MHSSSLASVGAPSRPWCVFRVVGPSMERAEQVLLAHLPWPVQSQFARLARAYHRWISRKLSPRTLSTFVTVSAIGRISQTRRKLVVAQDGHPESCGRKTACRLGKGALLLLSKLEENCQCVRDVTMLSLGIKWLLNASRLTCIRCHSSASFEIIVPAQIEITYFS